MKVTSTIRDSIVRKVFEAYKPRLLEAVAREEQLIKEITPVYQELEDRCSREMTGFLRRFGLDTQDNIRNLGFNISAENLVRHRYFNRYGHGGYSYFPDYLNVRIGDEVNEIVTIAQSHIDSIIIELELGEKSKAQTAMILDNIYPRDEVVECPKMNG